MTTKQKRTGAFFTPMEVAETLVRWAVRSDSDRLLDPSCGDGRFLVQHRNSTGVEYDSDSIAMAGQRAPWARLHNVDFFEWAKTADYRFECAAGNPPFIRYQLFAGDMRRHALSVCRELGADFSALTSSWAPFLVAACGMLLPGSQIAFVVPAEIGHAPYAKPLLKFLSSKFEIVHVVAIREKLFPQLSEDAWLLFASGFGSAASGIRFSAVSRFRPSRSPPADYIDISLGDLRQWDYRLRPFLLPERVRREYEASRSQPKAAVKLSSVANVGIGYVSGANDFFHLRPSEVARLGIDERFIVPTVRSSRQLSADTLTKATMREWLRDDQPVLLLRVFSDDTIPPAVQRYLDSPAGQQARTGYKCRNRRPWYVVPDVQKPDAFLSYMSGESPALVENKAGCVCSNAVHAVRLTDSCSIKALQSAWREPLTQLSCELEGHPLGGGMLKLEPREAGNVRFRLPTATSTRQRDEYFQEGIATMRAWRHYA